MPTIKSAIKRVRQAEKNRRRNLKFKNELKAAVKSVLTAVEKNDSKTANEMLTKAQSLLDKATKRNLYHKNKVSRQKSQLSKAVKQISGAKSTKTTKKTASKTTKTSKAKTTKKATKSTKKS